MHLPHFQNPTVEAIVYSIAGVLLLLIGYQVGRLVAMLGHSRRLRSKEQELFTTQRGFKQLYEQEIAAAKAEVAKLTEQVQSLTERVEAYRRKAAGYGGLFSGGGKRADAMYALLLENEQLEEALYSQNEKLRNERSDQLRETLRSTGYRRTLMTQLMSDERIKAYVAEVMNEQKSLPAPAASRRPNADNGDRGDHVDDGDSAPIS